MIVIIVSFCLHLYFTT